MLAHFAPKRLSCLTSYSAKVANRPMGTGINEVNLDLEIGPAGYLGDQGNHGT